MPTQRLLLCTDLDRTLIPNGEAPESPQARALFARLAASDAVTLAYVTGRHRQLVERAIAEYDLPLPDYVIGDVGSSIYATGGQTCDWQPVAAWAEEIGADWADGGRERLAAAFAERPELRLQEDEKQGPFKLSFYTAPELDSAALLAALHERLRQLGSCANLIWSVDEAANQGLLDVLPSGANKYHAIVFLMRLTGHNAHNTVFSGDSGNDLEVLTSPVLATLVANGHAEVKAQAEAQTRAAGLEATLYLARGDWRGLNGNYGAGILEGIAHYHPELVRALLG